MLACTLSGCVTEESPLYAGLLSVRMIDRGVRCRCDIRGSCWHLLRGELPLLPLLRGELPPLLLQSQEAVALTLPS